MKYIIHLFRKDHIPIFGKYRNLEDAIRIARNNVNQTSYNGFFVIRYDTKDLIHK